MSRTSGQKADSLVIQEGGFLYMCTHPCLKIKLKSHFKNQEIIIRLTILLDERHHLSLGRLHIYTSELNITKTLKTILVISSRLLIQGGGLISL